MTCLSSCVSAESYARLQNGRQTEDFANESERHRRVKRNERDFQRKQKKEAVATICAKLESTYENHETGKQYRLLRELGVNLKDDDYSGIEAITPEACRQHFLRSAVSQISGPGSAAASQCRIGQNQLLRSLLQRCTK